MDLLEMDLALSGGRKVLVSKEKQEFGHTDCV